MSTRSLVTVAGGLIGAYFGYPQLGIVLGGLVGGAVDTNTVQGPAINEVTVQTQAEGVPRIIPYATVMCVGNIIQNGPLIKTTETETQGKGGTQVDTPTAYRTFAIAICEGPIAGVLRVWEDNKLVYDVSPSSPILADSAVWAQNKFFRLGGEDQLPDPFLTFIDPETPAYRGTAFMTAVLENQTARSGSFAQYRFEVTRELTETPLDTVESTPFGAMGSLNGIFDGPVAPGMGGGGTWLPDAVTTATATTGVSGQLPNGNVVLLALRFQARGPGMNFTAWVKVNGETVWETTIFLSDGEFVRHRLQVNPRADGGVYLGTEIEMGFQAVTSSQGFYNLAGYQLNSAPWDAYVLPDHRLPVIYESDHPAFGVITDGSGLYRAGDVNDTGTITEWGPDSIQLNEGAPTTLGAIVADIHQRCNIAADLYNVDELTDEVDGFSIGGPYTGADAINALRAVHFFDKSDHDKQLWYPKRGKAVVKTLTIDNLTDVPDLSQREQAGEIPYKLNLAYQHAASGYATVKATAPSTPTPDRRTTGEVSMQTAVVMDEDHAYQCADIIYKITLTEANGTMELSLPLADACDLADADCVAVMLRGRQFRQRIEATAFDQGTMRLTLRADRQSAYTSDLTGFPIPTPTPPPSTITGETILIVAEISPRQDSEDDLHYLVAATGENPAWYGATIQRSTDGGASYVQATTVSRAARIGELLADVADADEFPTDTTNVVTVRLYREGQTLDSISDAAFLSEGGAFALEKNDSTWEVMQYRDAHENSDGSFTLSHLSRGRLNSKTSEHATGAKFVLLADMTHVAAQSGWIGTTLTHRAVSNGQAADDAVSQDLAFLGTSQIEWPVASLSATVSGTDLSASWAARHRLGTEDAPVASANFTGFRATVGNLAQNTVVETTAQSISGVDVSGLPTPYVVSVAALNRITGPGETSSVVFGGATPPSAFRDSGLPDLSSNPQFAHQIGNTIVVMSQAVGSSAIYFYDATTAVGLGGYGGGDNPVGCVSIGNITYAVFVRPSGQSRYVRIDRTVSYSVPTHIVDATTPTTDIVACGSDVWITQPYLGQMMKLNPATIAVTNYVFEGAKYLASDGVKVFGSQSTSVVVVDNATLATSTIPMASAFAVFDMDWVAGCLIISQDAVRAHDPATGAVLRVLDASTSDVTLSATGNILVLSRGITLPALVFQAADLVKTAEVTDPAADWTNRVLALTDSTILVGAVYSGGTSYKAKIFTA